MTSAYRSAEPNARKRARTGTFTSTEDVVMQAVKVGYKIADEQILKGQDFARRLRGAAVRSDVGDLGDLVDHGLRLARQLAILFLEFAETGSQPQTFLRAMRRAAEDANAPKPASTGPDIESALERPAPHATASAGGHHDIPIRVSSSKPTAVSLKLHRALPRDRDVTVFPLYSSAEDRNALTRVAFSKTPGAMVLNVDAQGARPGTYRGYAIDPSDQGLVATIEVVVDA
jgi:hypothetical protein